jgi:nucleotidyltransferase/DNA polymerase involved in DNA repair
MAAGFVELYENQPRNILYAMYRTLEYLRGISDSDVRRLRAVGIKHTNQLLHRTSLEIDRKRLSKRTGITTDRLLGFAHQCTLMEVSGMERQLQTIRRFGIETMKDLRSQDPEGLHSKLADAVGLAGAPSRSDVQYWISQATALDIIEEPEPTPTTSRIT